MRKRIEAILRNRAAVGLVALGLLLTVAVTAVVLSRSGGRFTFTRPGVEPPGFTVSPSGDNVSALTPIQVTFAMPPTEHDGARLVSLEPAVKGGYVWQSERTLIFQPDFPGLLRGQHYTLRVAAAPEAGLDSPFSRDFTTEGLLTVQSVIPAPDDVEVPREAQILVQFSRSVAPLTTLAAKSSKPVISFNPPLAGSGEWLNTSLYRFVPAPGALAGNTPYELRVPAGLTDGADGVLKQDYVWAFTTFSPAIEAVTPEVNTKFVGPRQEIRVRFNQPMDRASLESAFTLNGPNNRVQGSFGWSEGNSIVTFSPSQPLAPSARYELVIARGVGGAAGGTTQGEWRSSFDTVGTPAVAASTPAQGSTTADRFGVNLRFASPMAEDSFEGRTSITDISSDDIHPFLTPDGLSLFISVQLKPSNDYRLSLAAGVTDRYGQALAPYTLSFRTGARPSSITLAVPNEVATYSASSEPFLYYQAINLQEAAFTLYPLTADEMRTLQQRNYVSPDSTRPFMPSQPALDSWTEDASGPRDEVLLNSTSLSRDGKPLAKGDYLVRTGGQRRSDLAFSVVDTALVTKLSYNELLVWALDMDSGKPVEGVTVRASGSQLAGTDSARTNADGVASFEVKDQLASFPPQNRVFVVTLDDAGHRGVASTNWRQGAYPYQMDIPTEIYPRKYVGHIYADRPIYRTGEPVQFKGIVRLDDDASYSVPKQLDNVALVIRDPGGKEVSRRNVTLNDFGSFADTFSLSAEAATGNYTLQLWWEPARNFSFRIADTSFLVAEFRTPEFQVTAGTSQSTYASGDTVTASAEATFYFGGALAGAPVQWSVLSSPLTPRFKGFERYTFNDFDASRTQVSGLPLRQSGSSTTSASGVAEFSFPATISGNEGAQSYEISATVTDQSAQSVSAGTTVRVSPAAFFVGVRPAQYLASSGKEARVDVVSLDLYGNPAPGRRVSVAVYQRTWVTTKEQTPEGGRRYRSEPRDSLITTLDATTGSDGLGSVSFTASASGTLRVVAEVKDDKGRAGRAATSIWVYGGGTATWQITNDDSLKLIADKDEYKVGDTAEVLVPAPFEGATGLVTIERGKVTERSVRSFPTTSERLSIPIADNSVPNVFVSVVLYRAPTADDPVSRYKVGYVELPVSTDTRLLNVRIQPDREQTKPGETVRYDIDVTDASGKGVKAELSAAIVDKAVLSLTDERGVNGLKAFWFQRGLGVATASSLAVSVNRSNDVIADANAGGKGGGGLEDERIRQEFRNTAFWAAQVVTDGKGHASVSVKMPDNLTTWRMQVRAISGDILVGEATNEIVSTQQLLLRPQLPRFLRVGDHAMLRLLVRNAGKQKSDVNVSLAAEGLQLDGPERQIVAVEPGASATLEWPAVVSQEGTARLSFKAQGSDGLSDAVQLSLPVYLDTTPETTATGGIVTDQPVGEAVYLPSFAVLERGSLRVSVQASLTRSFAGDLEFFAPQPLDGLERVASRVIATLAAARVDPAVKTDRARADVADLTRSQHQDGGWAWCARCPTSDPRLTQTVLIALGEWRRDGNAVDQTVLNRASTYILSQVNRFADIAAPADPNDKAYLLYAIATATGSDTYLSTMRAVYEQERSRLTSWGRAYLLLGMAESGLTKKDEPVQRLMDDLASAAQTSANGNHWDDTNANSPTQTGPRTTALVLTALTRLDPQHPLIEKTVSWLSVALSTDVCRTTLERAQAILALSGFAVQTGELGGSYAYAVQLDNKTLLEGKLSPGAGGKTEEKEVPLRNLQAGRASILSFGRDSAVKGRLYYALNLRYVTPAAEVDALNRGFAVSRQFSALDDAGPISEARLGDIVRVKLTVVTPADRNYVQVDDFLPAGLEPIDPKLKTTDAALKARLQEELRQANRPPELTYYAPWLRWYYNPWQQVDLRDDRVSLSAQTLSKGVYEFVYYARATTPGEFFAAPPTAQESYFPDVFGRGDSSRFAVRP